MRPGVISIAGSLLMGALSIILWKIGARDTDFPAILAMIVSYDLWMQGLFLLVEKEEQE